MKSLFASNFVRGRRGPLLVVCLPLLCSCLMTWLGSRPQTLAHTPDLPGLAFDQYMVDLREIAPTEEAYGYFGFRNTSPHTLTIDKLIPSCGCLQPRLKKTVYKPGERGEFLLRIRTALQQPGPKEFTVTVNYTDSKPRTRDVKLRISFPEQQLYLTPRSMTIHQLGTSPVSQEFIVTDLRSTPAEVIGVESTSDLIELQVLDATTSSNGARQQRIRVTVPGSVPAGRKVAEIKIFTNDEHINELKVPVQIYGPQRHALTQRSLGPKMLGPVQR